MEILIGIGAFVAFVLFMYCVFAFVWVSTINKTSPRITFDAFRKMYVISPIKWSLNFENVGYHGNDGWIYIEFKHYIDVLRYGFFKDKIERIINDAQNNAENILQKVEVNSGSDDY